MPRVVRRQLGSAARTHQKFSHFKRAKAGTLPGPAEGNCAPQAHPGAGSCAGCLSLFACGCMTLIRKCGSGVLGVSSPRRGKARTLESPARQKTHRNCPSKVVPPPVIFVRLFLSHVTTQETQFRWPAHESGRPRRRSVPVGGLARPPGYPRRGGGHTQVGGQGPLAFATFCKILENQDFYIILYIILFCACFIYRAPPSSRLNSPVSTMGVLLQQQRAMEMREVIA